MRMLSSADWNNTDLSSNCAEMKSNNPASISQLFQIIPVKMNRIANPWPMVTARRVAVR